jgi:hypothetical protein
VTLIPWHRVIHHIHFFYTKPSPPARTTASHSPHVLPITFHILIFRSRSREAEKGGNSGDRRKSHNGTKAVGAGVMIVACRGRGN